MRSKLSCYAYKMHCCICKIVVQDCGIFWGSGLVIIKQIDKKSREKNQNIPPQKITNSQKPRAREEVRNKETTIKPVNN